MFTKNLEAFGYKNPKASVLLSFVEPIDVTDSETLANQWKERLALDGVEIVCLYGLGLGYSYFSLKSWLDKDAARTLFIVEDDLRVILRFLQSPNGEKLLANPQVHVFYIENSADGLEVLKGISWAAYGKKMLITHLPQASSKTFEDVKARLEYESSDIHIILDEYMGYGAAYYRNFWKNLQLLPGSYRGNKLKGMFKGIPAIVVAAGPSLGKQYDFLRSLKDRALIFSGGSSTNALLDAGIIPHFGAGIDPNPTQYLRFRQALSFQLPIFYRSRLLHESLKLVQGPRLYLKGGDGYNISDWFEKKLKIPGEILGGGHSVSNFIIEIAHSLGCSPIILVGYDLAFGQKSERYAKGVEAGEHEALEDKPIDWKDHKGNPIKSAWKWVLEAKWIEDFAKEAPKCRLINATEGGLGMQGIIHMSLKEASGKYLQKSYDLDSLVHTAIEDAGTIEATRGSIEKKCRIMHVSLERAKVLLEQLAQMGSVEALDSVLLEAELKGEVAYQYVLEVFDRMRKKLEYYRFEFFRHHTRSRQEEEAFLQKQHVERCQFLRDVCQRTQEFIYA